MLHAKVAAHCLQARQHFCVHINMESEIYAAKLQLQELQERLQCSMDARTAVLLHLQQNSCDQQGGEQNTQHLGSSSMPLDDWEAYQVQEQIESLSAFIMSYEGHKTASQLEVQEAANSAAYDASLKLAETSAAQESWDKQLCDHDAEFARMLLTCSNQEWYERGDLLERPLHLAPRPASPDNNSDHATQNSRQQPAAAPAPPAIHIQTGTCRVLGPAAAAAAAPASHPINNNSSNSSRSSSHYAASSQEQGSSSSIVGGRAPICYTSGVAILDHDVGSSSSSSGRQYGKSGAGPSSSGSSSSRGAAPFCYTSGFAVVNNNAAGATVNPSTAQSGVAVAQGSSSSSSSSPCIVQTGIAVVGSNTGSSSSGGSDRHISDPKGKRPMQEQQRQQQPLAVSDHSTNSSSTNTVPAASSSSSSVPKHQCSICFDSYPLSSMMSAVLPQKAASSSAAQGRCGHYFCRDCMKSYVLEQLKARKYPICCPMPSCQEELSHDDVAQLLSNNTKELQVYDMLVMENSIEASLRVYCPYKDCSCLLERPEEEELQNNQGQDGPFECPSCNRVFCLSCGIAGWHTGMTCQQFQLLPPELRSVEDAAMLRMAAAQQWKRCPAPGCGHVVERTEGCNHMRCRCGVDFCYACGKQYRSAIPTADNVHGTPGCGCPLFAVPEEEPEVVQPAVPVVPLMLRPARRRPWRGGRLVSRTRCWHSDSLYDCPNGPERCWFWHDEDDEY